VSRFETPSSSHTQPRIVQKFRWRYWARCDAAEWGRVSERPTYSSGNFATAPDFSVSPPAVRRLGQPPLSSRILVEASGAL
jgi:hypothetical protein